MLFSPWEFILQVLIHFENLDEDNSVNLSAGSANKMSSIIEQFIQCSRKSDFNNHQRVPCLDIELGLHLGLLCCFQGYSCYTISICWNRQLLDRSYQLVSLQRKKQDPGWCRFLVLNRQIFQADPVVELNRCRRRARIEQNEILIV